MMLKLFSSVCLFMLGLTGVAYALPQEPVSTLQAGDGPALHDLTLDFQSMGVQDAAPLRGVDGNLVLPFGIRLDESVAKATLHLRYSYSPSLIPELSHLRILLNKEVVGTVPLPKQTVSGQVTSDVAIDPRYFSDFNQLAVQLVGHYTTECEDAMHSSLWASISAKSSLQLSLRKLNLSDAQLPFPAPFFDRRDTRRLVLPFVFAAKPSLEILNAAGVVSSWFGAQASYRSARFPVMLNQLPDRHAVIFMTNDSRVEGVNLPTVTVPTISVVNHPGDASIKLLILQGQDAAQLKTAADALVLGQALLTGGTATVSSVQYDPRRPAYDAPNWVRSDRPVKLGELVENISELQRLGHVPDPIRVNLHMPPDLMTWNRSGVPIDLKYRYTPPIEQDNSTLSVNINDSFVQAYRLRSGGVSAPGNRLVVPLLESGQIQERSTLTIPAFQIGSNNQLQFLFAVDYHKKEQCKDTLTDAVHVAIDPNSSIDLSDFPHYTAMPNLALFANAGFPFTKYADLAETAVVMPDQYGSDDIEQMLFMLGRMGRMTGVAALRFQLADNARAAQYADRDLLILGGGKPQDLLSRWQKDLPVMIEQSRRSFAPAAETKRWASEFLGIETRKPVANAWNVTFDTKGPLAAVMGFESPLKNDRSIVALAASSDAAHGQLTDVFEDEGLISNVRGDVTLIRGRVVSAYQVGEIYYSGELHWWIKLWLVLSRHPVLLSVFGILAALTLGLWAYSFLQSRASRRMDAQ